MSSEGDLMAQAERDGVERLALSEGWFLVAGGGRRWGLVPIGTARWCPKYMNPDRSTWLPVCRRYGLTIGHAMSRAKSAVELPRFEYVGTIYDEKGRPQRLDLRQTRGQP